MVLIGIEMFMWWCDIILNALLLIVMSYVDVMELYKMYFICDG